MDETGNFSAGILRAAHFRPWASGSSLRKRCGRRGRGGPARDSLEARGSISACRPGTAGSYRKGFRGQNHRQSRGDLFRRGRPDEKSYKSPIHRPRGATDRRKTVGKIDSFVLDKDLKKIADAMTAADGLAVFDMFAIAGAQYFSCENTIQPLALSDQFSGGTLSARAPPRFAPTP